MACRNTCLRVPLNTTRSILLWVRTANSRSYLSCTSRYTFGIELGRQSNWSPAHLWQDHSSQADHRQNSFSPSSQCTHLKWAYLNLKVSTTSFNMLLPRSQPLRYLSQLVTGMVTLALLPVCSVMPMVVWCTEDEAPIEGMGLSGWPAHAQECDMESRGSLKWEALSQAGIDGVDGCDWHHRALARGLCVCPESTRGVGAGSGYIVLLSGLLWKSRVCVWSRDRDWIADRGLCTGCWGRVTTTCRVATRFVVGLL